MEGFSLDYHDTPTNVRVRKLVVTETVAVSKCEGSIDHVLISADVIVIQSPRSTMLTATCHHITSYHTIPIPTSLSSSLLFSLFLPFLPLTPPSSRILLSHPSLPSPRNATRRNHNHSTHFHQQRDNPIHRSIDRSIDGSITISNAILLPPSYVPPSHSLSMCNRK